MRRAVTLAALLLAGCATQAGFDARMQAVIGMTEGDLVQRYGVPEADFITPEGRRFLQYERLGIRTPAPAPVLGVGVGGIGWRGGYGGGVGIGTTWPVYAPLPECRVTFEVRDGRVASFTRAGSGCLATPPG